VGAAVDVERCTGDANLGDEGDEGKEPSSLEPRAGAVVGVERCNLGMQANLGDGGVEGKERAIIVGAACGSGSRCREMQLGDANLGDEGDEGRGPSPLGPRVGAAEGVSRDVQVMKILATRVTKEKSHHRWGRVWERWRVSRDATWECM
jgi:hypothetical protein